MLVAAVTVSLLGCSTANPRGTSGEADLSEQMLLRDTDSLVPLAAITKAQLQEDLILLRYALTHGYAGRDHIAPGAFQAALSSIAALGESVGAALPTSELLERLTDILWPLPDSHLLVGVAGKRDLGTARRLSLIKAGVGPNLCQRTDRPWEVGSVSVSGRDIPFIAFGAFPYHESPVWKGFPEAYAKVLKASPPAIILDFRGNEGGDNTWGMRLAQELFGQDIPPAVKARHFSQTPATFALSANNWKLEILMARKKGRTPEAYAQKNLDYLLTKLSEARRGRLPPERVERWDQPRPDLAKMYQGLVVLLADRQSGSSGESLIPVLRPLPRMSFVGENTWGAIEYGDVGGIWMHNSQIFVSMATDYWEHWDGRGHEKTGWEPDLRLASGQDALDAAKGLIADHLLGQPPTP